MESLPEWDSGLGIDECRAGLSFGGRREDVAHDASEDTEGPIEWGGEVTEFVGMGAEPKETSGLGASIGLRETGGISVVVEDHVTCKEFDDAFGMSGCIVEQVNAGMGGGFSGAGLLRHNGADAPLGLANRARWVTHYSYNSYCIDRCLDQGYHGVRGVRGGRLLAIPSGGLTGLCGCCYCCGSDSHRVSCGIPTARVCPSIRVVLSFFELTRLIMRSYPMNALGVIGLRALSHGAPCGGLTAWSD